MIELYGNKEIYVRPFKESDIKEPYTNWFHDPEVTRFNSHGLFPYTEKQKIDFINTLDSNVVWAIMIRRKLIGSAFGHYEHHLHIGNVALQSIDWINRSAEFAIVIGHTDSWRKGVCCTVANWLFDHGFNKLGLNRIWSGTAAVNHGMIKSFKKLGMTEEGRFRQGTYLAGDYYDVLSYGILKGEY